MSLQEFLDSYKKIQKTCLEEGVLIPELICPIRIPYEYRLNKAEIGTITKDKEKLQQAYMHKTQTENEIMNGNHKEYKTLTQYYEHELEEWLEQFPKYEKMIR